MKIAIVVHGRFHGFHLARSLLRRGHDVRVFTNYPKWAVRRFGLADEHVDTFPLHGILAKGIDCASHLVPFQSFTAAMHRMFGAWAAERVSREHWDVVHSFTGVAEELLSKKQKDCQYFVVRGSAHIRTQHQLLDEEAKRAGQWIDLPAPWMMEREEREYQMCDRIVVLSSFAYQSFCERGVPADKLAIIPLGVGTSQFRPAEEVVRKRVDRVLSGAPLRILTVGTLSLQKGAVDLACIVNSLPEGAFAFTFVGSISKDAKKLRRQLSSVQCFPRQAEYTLPARYAEADLFLFLTIQDGFAAVLAQAAANALPILTTRNCAGVDLVKEGLTGWVLPIRSPEEFINRLRWCNEHREELGEMVKGIYRSFRPRDWDDVAEDFERLCMAEIRAHG